MTGSVEPPLSREELLGGFVGRRASTTLFAIQARTAVLALQASHATAPAICDSMFATQERAVLAAMAGGRDLPRAPTIQQLERYAGGWRHLAPRDPDGRAGVARRMGATYRFRETDVPRLRDALGLDDPATDAAHRDRFGQDVEDVYADRLPAGDRMRWAGVRVATWLSELSPLWTAFALTLTQTVGAGILALPIAFAGIGPAAGLGVLVVLGAVNVLTAAAMAEAFARTGSVRWGGASFGRVVSSYLGPAIGAVTTVALVALSVLVVGAYYIGLGTALASATGVPAAVWAGVLFVLVLAGAGRGRAGGTLASALIVGFVNLTLIVLLAVLGLLHLEPSNLVATGGPLTGPGIIGPVFGVGLMAFFGHTAVASGARVVLRREPDGRALVRGTALAMVTAIVLYALWVAAIGGAVSHERLVGSQGTALEPLAEVVGSVVFVPGTLFVVLSMGMGAVLFSLGLHHQATEWVPGGGRWRRVAGLVPLVGIFLAVEALLLTGRESFTGALSLVGVLTAPLLAGVVPVLLLGAARRRGEYVPTTMVPVLLRRPVALTVLGLFIAALVAHGALLWDGLGARAAALVVAGVLTVVCVWVVRSGALRPTTAVELRRDVDLDQYRLRVTVVGRRGDLEVGIETTAGEPRFAHVAGSLVLPTGTTRVTIPLADDDGTRTRVHVWAHEVDTTAASGPFAVSATVVDGDSTPLELRDGHGELSADRGALVLAWTPRAVPST